MIKQIVNIINASLKSALTDPRFNTASIYGIATPMTRTKSKVQFPCYVDDSGEAHYVGYDDAKSLTVYHKNYGFNYMPTKDRQFGDSQNNLTLKANMSMVALAMRDDINLQPEDLDVLLVCATPSYLTKEQLCKLNIQQCLITHVTSDFQYLSIFKREFINAGEGLAVPDLEMIEIKYSIECQFHKDCINILSES